MHTHENWPSLRSQGNCGCARCRARWRDARQIALAHAQNRMVGEAAEAAFADLRIGPGAAYETVYGDYSVRWERRMPLANFLALPDPRYRDPARQWNYRIYLKGDTRPLYLGKTGPRAKGVKKGVRHRLQDHSRGTGGTVLPGVTTIADAQALAAKHRAAPLKHLRGDTKLLADLIKSLGSGNFDVKVGEVVKRKVGLGGKVTFTPPDIGASLLTERFQLKGGVARINRRDRAEDDVEVAAALLADEYVFEES